ncbi:MAG: putative nucleotidyltransferase substrate binding domain-containing protein [Desulfuromonadales bacterium]
MGSIQNFRDAEPFKLLPEEIVNELHAAAVVKKYPAHCQIFQQHDPPTGFLYVVKEGLVEIVALTPGGVEMVVDYRQEGTFFGGTPIFTRETYTAGARTVQATECYLIPQQLLTKAAKQYPHITEHFTHAILSRVRSLYSEMVDEHAKKALTQMEAYPFRKRLSEIMSCPVETCPPHTPVREIAYRLTKQGVSAMVVSDGTRTAAGIITEHDLVSKVLAREAVDCNAATAAEVMTPHPFTMAPDAYMYEATTFMLGHKIKHLPVLDRGEIVGLVTLQDLMKYRSQKSMLLLGSVNEARTVEDLVAARARMVRVAKALIGEARSHFETMEILSYIHHSIMRRCFEIVLEEVKREGMHPPDIRFCLFIMGSGGRKEMLLGPDQDNGLIYENFPDAKTEEVDAFFVPFSERLVKSFERVGYPLCNGKVMVNNSLWRGRLKDWEARISHWINVPEPKKVMYSTIFLDFMPLLGDPTLCQDLRAILHREIRKRPIFLFHLLENDLNHKPPVGLLGRFIVERSGDFKGQLSLKQAGSIFIVDCVRMFLLEKGIDATTTIERLDLLTKLNVFSQETADHLKAAFEAFVFLRLRHEIALIDQGREPTHYIDPYSLNKNEQDLLQEAFRAAGKLQDSTRRHFGRGFR